MSFSDTLRKARKSVVAGALAVAAMVAPIKGQSQEAKSETEPAKTVEVSKAKRQQMLEDAIKSGASKEEIAKYIDFPEFIPVTEDGQLDMAKADEYAKALAPYVKTLAEKGDNISAVEAYKAFKEATGKKNISFEEFEKVRELAENAAEHHGNRGLEGTACMFAGVFTAGLACYSMLMAADLKDKSISYGYFGSKSINSLALTGTVIAGTTALALGAFTVLSAKVGLDCFKRAPEQSVREVYENAHESYVNDVVEGKQQQYKLMNMDQARQYIQQLQSQK